MRKELLLIDLYNKVATYVLTENNGGEVTKIEENVYRFEDYKIPDEDVLMNIIEEYPGVPCVYL